jgi:hypothetical protein
MYAGVYVSARAQVCGGFLWVEVRHDSMYVRGLVSIYGVLHIVGQVISCV